MNIAFLIDDSYSEQLAVTLASVLKHNKTHISVYVLDMGISEINKQKISALKGNYELQFIPVKPELFKNFPKVYHLKTMNYARILLSSLVDCSRILFLDCDLLVLGDLDEFYHTDFKDAYAVCVRERLADTPRIRRQMQVLGVKKYFNAGVMLMNLDKMREDKIAEKSLDFAKNYPEKILLLDQCVLNYVFGDNVILADKKYNFQYKLTVTRLEGKPVIIHFVGAEKPYFGYAHPFENLYYKYLKLTPYQVPFWKFKRHMLELFWEKFKKRVCVLFLCMV